MFPCCEGLYELLSLKLWGFSEILLFDQGKKKPQFKAIRQAILNVDNNGKVVLYVDDGKRKVDYANVQYKY